MHGHFQSRDKDMRSHHSIHHDRQKPHVTSKPHGSIFSRTGGMGDQSYTLWE